MYDGARAQPTHSICVLPLSTPQPSSAALARTSASEGRVVIGGTLGGLVSWVFPPHLDKGEPGGGRVRCEEVNLGQGPSRCTSLCCHLTSRQVLASFICTAPTAPALSIQAPPALVAGVAGEGAQREDIGRSRSWVAAGGGGGLGGGGTGGGAGGGQSAEYVASAQCLPQVSLGGGGGGGGGGAAAGGKGGGMQEACPGKGSGGGTGGAGEGAGGGARRSVGGGGGEGGGGHQNTRIQGTSAAVGPGGEGGERMGRGWGEGEERSGQRAGRAHGDVVMIVDSASESEVSEAELLKSPLYHGFI